MVESLPFLSLSEEGRRHSSVRFFLSSRSDTSVVFFFSSREPELAEATENRNLPFDPSSSLQHRGKLRRPEDLQPQKSSRERRHHHAAMLRVLYKASETRHGRERRKILVLDFDADRPAGEKRSPVAAANVMPFSHGRGGPILRTARETSPPD